MLFDIWILRIRLAIHIYRCTRSTNSTKGDEKICFILKMNG